MILRPIDESLLVTTFYGKVIGLLRQESPKTESDIEAIIGLHTSSRPGVAESIVRSVLMTHSKDGYDHEDGLKLVASAYYDLCVSGKADEIIAAGIIVELHALAAPDWPGFFWTKPLMNLHMPLRNEHTRPAQWMENGPYKIGDVLTDLDSFEKPMKMIPGWNGFFIRKKT